VVHDQAKRNHCANAVRGLLKVDPKQLKKRTAKKKAAKKVTRKKG